MQVLIERARAVACGYLGIQEPRCLTFVMNVSVGLFLVMKVSERLSETSDLSVSAYQDFRLYVFWYVRTACASLHNLISWYAPKLPDLTFQTRERLSARSR